MVGKAHLVKLLSRESILYIVLCTYLLSSPIPSRHHLQEGEITSSSFSPLISQIHSLALDYPNYAELSRLSSFDCLITAAEGSIMTPHLLPSALFRRQILLVRQLGSRETVGSAARSVKPLSSKRWIVSLRMTNVFPVINPSFLGYMGNISSHIIS